MITLGAIRDSDLRREMEFLDSEHAFSIILVCIVEREAIKAQPSNLPMVLKSQIVQQKVSKTVQVVELQEIPALVR